MTNRPDTLIRPYAEGDEAEMVHLYRSAVESIGAKAYAPAQVAAWMSVAPDAARFREAATDGRLTLIAEDPDGGAMLAFGDVTDGGFINFLYRRPEPAARGAASSILDALLDAGRRAGTMTFTVEASELARPLFERKGFTVVERRDFDIAGVPIYNYRMAREG